LVMGSTILLYYVAGRGLAAPSDYMAFNAAYGAVSSALLSLGGVVVSLANVKLHLEMVKPILETPPEFHAGKKQVMRCRAGSKCPMLPSATPQMDPWY